MQTLQVVKAQVANQPVITWALAAAILSGLTLVALPGFPLWAHTAIVVASTIVSAVAAHTKVSPISK